jgi:hypothetical protein
VKKTGKILLAIIAVLIAVLILATGYVFVFHKDLVQMVYKGVTSSQEQLEEQLDQNKQQEQKAVTDAGLNAITIDKETEQKILSGEVSQQDIADMLLDNENSQLGEQQKENPSSQQNPPEQTATQNKEQTDNVIDTEQNKDQENNNQKIAELVAQMYVYKAQYTSEIEKIIDSMKKEYSALPEDQKTAAAKTAIVSKYLNTISAMEAQCDAQVNSLVEQLRQALEKAGQDVSLADSILQAYKDEKEITKSYYISKYS